MRQDPSADPRTPLLIQAIELLRRGDPARSLEMLRPLAELDPRKAARWPNHKVALDHCILALSQLGRFREALALQVRLQAQYGGGAEARANFFRLLRAVGEDLPAAPEFRRELATALRDTDASEFAVPVVRALGRDPALGKVLAELAGGSDAAAVRALRGGRLRGLCHEPLLELLMRRTLIPLPEFERAMARLRRAYLLAFADAADRPGRVEREFLGVLAHYLWITEYAFGELPDERERLDALWARTEAALPAAGPVPEPVVADLALLALYRPWRDLAGGRALLERPLADWKPWLQPLVRDWQAQAEEEALLPSIGRLTPIGEGVSAAVRRQYEEHPYPRWRHRPAATAPVAAADWLQALAPGIDWPPRFAAPVDILVAGCGTGLEAAHLAGRLLARRVLAVDLSLASLACAIRTTRELGIGGIEFKQADILRLGSLPDRFDLVSANGVLHHLDDPPAGWAVLAGLLKPGGAMLVSLYSATACRPIEAARRLIAEQGWEASPERMRDLRAAILDGRREGLEDLPRWRDFYSLGMFRDLVFHVREHRYTLPEIGRCLDRLGLEFVAMEGLGGEVRAAYRAMFPDDPAGRNLGHWAEFEERHPLTFVNMYSFLAVRRA